MLELIDHKKEVKIASDNYTDFAVDELLFLGMRTLAISNQQGLLQYRTIPIEHTAMFPVFFNQSGSQFQFEERSRIWLAQPLYDSMFKHESVQAIFKVEKLKESSKVIILNCLDACYGHALDKLFNAQRHLEVHSEYGLVVIIHPSMRQLVPDGIVEVWKVEVPFSAFEMRIEGFDEFFKSEIKRFDQVQLSKAAMYLDYSKIDISIFTKCKSFPEEKFHIKPIQIVFVLREDRFWLINSWNQFLYLVATRFKLMRYLKGYFVSIQNRNFRKLAKRLKKSMGDMKLIAVGLGKTVSLGKNIDDKRETLSEYLKYESERDQLYATSHLVIGVHGSHLLIPTALAGSFISLLPDYKIEGYSEDFMPRYENIQKQVLLGRFLPSAISTKTLSEHIHKMIGSD